MTILLMISEIIKIFKDFIYLNKQFSNYLYIIII